MGILEQFQKQLTEDEKNQDYRYTPDMSEDDKAKYRETLDAMREEIKNYDAERAATTHIENESHSYDEIGGQKPEMPNVNKWFPGNEIVETPNKNVYSDDDISTEDSLLASYPSGFHGYIRKAHCPHCDGDLEGLSAPMYNPFTLKGIAVNACSNCGAKITLSHAYPRFIIRDAMNNEIKLHF